MLSATVLSAVLAQLIQSGSSAQRALWPLLGHQHRAISYITLSNLISTILSLLNSPLLPPQRYASSVPSFSVQPRWIAVVKYVFKADFAPLLEAQNALTCAWDRHQSIGISISCSAFFSELELS